jgi:hypothetical protein
MDRYLGIVPKYLLAVGAELVLAIYVSTVVSQRLADKVSALLQLGGVAIAAAACIWAAALVCAHSLSGLYKPDLRTFATILLGTAAGAVYLGKGALPLTHELAPWIVVPGILGWLISRKPAATPRDPYRY